MGLRIWGFTDVEMYFKKPTSVAMTSNSKKLATFSSPRIRMVLACPPLGAQLLGGAAGVPGHGLFHFFHGRDGPSKLP